MEKSGKSHKVLNPQIVRFLLGEYFPGIQFKSGDRIGGLVFRGEVWQFLIEVSVTTQEGSANDPIGLTKFMFRQKLSVRGQENVQYTVRHEAELEHCLKIIRSKIMGIAAALLMACEKGPPPNILGK